MVDEKDVSKEVARIRQRLADLDAERTALSRELETLEQTRISDNGAAGQPSFADAPVTNNSSSAEKIVLFRRLFAGRPDVFPVRWENRKTGGSGYLPACSNEWAKGICGKPKVKCGECPHQAFVPPSEDIIEKHLRGGNVRSGDFVAGVYPLLHDETCWFLAADFDKESWADDARALLDTCHAKGVAAALERSRSGNGGHVWIFFSEPVPARIARQMGAALITETMEKRPEIGRTSYDRFWTIRASRRRSTPAWSKPRTESHRTSSGPAATVTSTEGRNRPAPPSGAFCLTRRSSVEWPRRAVAL